MQGHLEREVAWLLSANEDEACVLPARPEPVVVGG